MNTLKPLKILINLFRFSVILFVAIACQANNSGQPAAPAGGIDTKNVDGIFSNPNALSILVDHSNLQMKQNEYGEIEVSAAGQNLSQLDWFAEEDDAFPPGLEIQPVDATRALLRGYPQFAGTWCFKLNVRDQASNSRMRNRICLNSIEDESYPLKFKSSQTLPTAQINKYYSQQIMFESRQSSNINLQGQIFGGHAEPFQVQYQNSSKRFLVIGQTGNQEQKSFSLRLWTQSDAAGSETEFYEVYRQFTLNIIDQVDNQYACPAGYYYSDVLNYCVQGGGAICSPDTFYNPETNTCVRYASPPTYITCSYNEVFDSYLGQCVLRDYPRCPLNYSWNAYENRCNRLPYTCPIGTTYSYSTNTCIRIWQQSCGYNEYWDNYSNRCRVIIRSCPVGSYWNPSLNRCDVSSYYTRCSRDEQWNWSSNRCERYSTPHCGFNEYYDYNRRSCLRREIDQSCNNRERWSSGDRRCVPWVTPDPVRPPPRREPVRPAPVRPGPRPEPVRPAPERPGPRPEPVRPAPERPRPEPVRPAPERPRPEPVRPAPERPAPTPPPRPEPVRPAPERPRPEPVRPAPERPRPEPVRPAPERPAP
ncbi:MAG: hypothetical protein AABY64_08560, partial [Bdellovibrionota bacterium]